MPSLSLTASAFLPSPVIPTHMSTNPATALSPAPRIPTSDFYAQYHGHPLPHLATLLHSLPPSPKIYLAGDSTLDNKYWLPPPHVPAPPAFTTLFDPPLACRDIAYWLNTLPLRSAPFLTLNAAVEATTLRQRLREPLPHDRFIADNLSPHDVLVVSVGGNDIALAPTLPLVLSALAATYFFPALGMRALARLFVDDMTAYVQMLVREGKPRLVVLCGLYFPDEAPQQSWASFTLGVLLYGIRPQRMQEVMRAVFEQMKSVRVEGVKLVHVPLFEALDGKDTRDYVERVEPSELGGVKIAKLLRDAIDRELGESQGDKSETKGGSS